MKGFFLLLAKLIVMGFWLGSVYFTFLHPLEGRIHTLIPVFAVLVLMVHAIQAAIMTLVAKDLIKLSPRDYIELLLFGFFRMLELRGEIYEAAQRKKAEIEAKKANNAHH
ncbi:DUF1145 domain-containing protein [Tolumonas osonensis]|uniref:Putative membrane protein n=1 Tax=Tolumonas osonensis TaxID=675874 RepID=A0A841GBF8_9GAMM|nr:DUF1145 domain-containing protein [Tolumonas osonensis]MBB6056458.1 putative membrane protein [Tolumonas osonensis]